MTSLNLPLRAEASLTTEGPVPSCLTGSFWFVLGWFTGSSQYWAVSCPSVLSCVPVVPSWFTGMSRLVPGCLTGSSWFVLGWFWELPVVLGCLTGSSQYRAVSCPSVFCVPVVPGRRRLYEPAVPTSRITQVLLRGLVSSRPRLCPAVTPPPEDSSHWSVCPPAGLRPWTPTSSVTWRPSSGANCPTGNCSST